MFPVRGIGWVHIHCLHQLEGVDVCRVGHHTHLHGGVVTGAAGLGPEKQLHIRYGVCHSVERWQHYALVVAIGARGGAVIPVQSLRASRRMIIGR